MVRKLGVRHNADSSLWAVVGVGVFNSCPRMSKCSISKLAWTVSAICHAFDLGSTTVQPYLLQLEAAGIVFGTPPIGGSRRGIWVTYRLNSQAVSDLYLRLGVAIGER